MARGSNESSNLNLFYMKITGLKKGEKAYIEQTQAKGDKEYVVLDEKINQVSGRFHEVKIRSYTYEGEEIEQLQVWLKDTLAGEMYCVQCGINSIGRSIINTLLGIEGEVGDLMIRVYNKKDSDFPSVYIEHNGEKAGWKYDVAAQNEYVDETSEKKKVGNKIETVVRKQYLRLNDFLLSELKEKFASTKTESGSEPAAEAEAQSYNGLPF